MIFDLNRLFENIEEKPAIIFDLKGILPRVTKISYGIQKLTIKKGDKIKLLCGKSIVNDPQLIHIDKNISNSLEIGDRIIVDSSGSILRVKNITYYSNKMRNESKRKSSTNSSSLEKINLAKNLIKESYKSDNDNSIENMSLSSLKDSNNNYTSEFNGSKSESSIGINDIKTDLTSKSFKLLDDNFMDIIKEDEYDNNHNKELPLFEVDKNNYWKIDYSIIKNKQNKI